MKYTIPPAYAWIKRIQKGDILEARSGTLRIVRSVRHNGPSLPKTSVTFTIRHCSWTGRCYTVVNGNDLRQMRFRPVSARMPLRTKLDKLIEAEFGRPPGDGRMLDCCDVRGIA